MEALHALVQKNTIELVKTQTSLGFYNRLFLVPKPNNRKLNFYKLITLPNGHYDAQNSTAHFSKIGTVWPLQVDLKQ